MSNLLCVPIELFSSNQNGLEALVAILGNIFPLLVVDMIVFSQTHYSLYYSDERYLFALLVTVSMIFVKMSLQTSMTFGVWLSHYPRLFSKLLCWDRGSYFIRIFSWDSSLDHSFDTTMDSSSRALRVRDVWLIVALRQISRLSQMGCEAIFIVYLTILTH